MGLLINTSLITAFFAGVAALFAPCCITVLLPTYLASIFSQKRRVFFMTFVFFLGILVVFLPLGLGFGALGAIFSQLHDWIFLGGALFLVLLAFSLFFGFHPRLPFYVNPVPGAPNIPAIFLLGTFSGLATVCCAPVLAGVLTLSILPGSVFWGGMYTLGYVLGMVVPLFVIALFLDRVNFTEKFLLFRKAVRVLGKDMTLSNLLASLMFLVMGVLILVLSLTEQLRMESALQIRVNLLITKYIESVSTLVKNIPEFVLPLLFVLLLVAIIIISAVRRDRR